MIVISASPLAYQTIFDKRYLCFMQWEQIAVDRGYELRYIHMLHKQSLENVSISNNSLLRFLTRCRIISLSEKGGLK